MGVHDVVQTMVQANRAPEGNVRRVDAHDSYVEVARRWNRQSTSDTVSSVTPCFGKRKLLRLSDIQAAGPSPATLPEWMAP
jgi:hypothetical protein